MFLVNRHIFREYDIRGSADRDLTNGVVRAIGLAIGERCSGREVVIGRDCRLSSPRIFDAVSRGVRAHATVLDIGEVPTPVAYFAQQDLRPAATIMITGSHNPAEDNGLKIMIGDETLYGTAITELRNQVNGILEEPEAWISPRYFVRAVDMDSSYIERAEAELRLGERRLKVVVDAGNGAGGPTAVSLYTRLGFDVVPLYCAPDGNFPNHHPDPTQPENLSDLIMAVQALGAEVGIALDGDADRLGVVDATGRILWGDQLMLLFGRAIRDEVPDAKFVAEVKCSQTLFDELPSCEMYKVGHSLIKARMRETGALLAGEMSGHLFFKHRWLGFDDGIYAGARLLELLSRTDRTLADLVADLPVTCSTPEIRVNCDDDEKFAVVRQVANRLRTHPYVTEVCEIDGVRVKFDGGWGLVRASNTQAALVMRCEAADPTTLSRVKNLIEWCIDASRRPGVGRID